ncbi:DNA mismatch repair protein [Apophysomyces sp. BC1021]|nr:DNA mismatch repair protein [Apophysomyces sp. BC1021]
MTIWKVTYGKAEFQRGKIWGPRMDNWFSSRRIIMARDNLGHFPVRRKQQRHLHCNATLEKIKRSVANVAIAFPQVSFIVQDVSRNSKVLVTKKCSSSIAIFRQLFGQNLAQDLKPFDVHENDFKLHGYLATKGFPSKVCVSQAAPLKTFSLHLSYKTHQYIYVNHQWIAPNELHKAVVETFSHSKINEMTKAGTCLAKQSTHRLIFLAAWLEKHPIFLIQVECPSLSSYDISLYLNTLYEHEVSPDCF